MRERSLKIIVVLAFFNFSASLNAQKIFPDTETKQWKSQNYSNEKLWKKFSPIHAKKATFNFFSHDLIGGQLCKESCFAPGITKLYKQGLGFMCRQELKLDHITAVNIRLRLGSLDYVNQLEGKPNAALNH